MYIRIKALWGAPVFHESLHKYDEMEPDLDPEVTWRNLTKVFLPIQTFINVHMRITYRGKCCANVTAFTSTARFWDEGTLQLPGGLWRRVCNEHQWIGLISVLRASLVKVNRQSTHELAGYLWNPVLLYSMRQLQALVHRLGSFFLCLFTNMPTSIWALTVALACASSIFFCNFFYFTKVREYTERFLNGVRIVFLGLCLLLSFSQRRFFLDFVHVLGSPGLWKITEILAR